jgi:hypothetical protein
VLSLKPDNGITIRKMSKGLFLISSWIASEAANAAEQCIRSEQRMKQEDRQSQHHKLELEEWEHGDLAGEQMQQQVVG